MPIYFLKTVNASIALPIRSTRKIKKMVLAMDAAPAAIPVKPKIAATIAITRKMAVHFNIGMIFKNFLFYIFIIVLVR